MDAERGSSGVGRGSVVHRGPGSEAVPRGRSGPDHRGPEASTRFDRAEPRNGDATSGGGGPMWRQFHVRGVVATLERWGFPLAGDAPPAWPAGAGPAAESAAGGGGAEPGWAGPATATAARAARRGGTA